MSTPSIISIGIAEVGIGISPQILKTTGLGSCIGLVLYDDQKKIAGMVHMMLPSVLSKQDPFSSLKFIETAVPYLKEKLVRKGASAGRLRAKFAGGASMLQTTVQHNVFKVGEQNIRMIFKILQDYDIPIMSYDVGGNWSRTVYFHIETAEFIVQYANGTKKVL